MNINGKAIRIITVLMLMISLAAVMPGCKNDTSDSDSENFTLNESAMAEDVLGKVDFESEMIEIDADAAAILYTIEENVQVKAYVAGGALADELVIFTAGDGQTASKMYENAKTHIEERAKLFEDYAPDEVAKLNKAYVKQRGRYVVVCVCKNAEQASEAIGKYF